MFINSKELQHLCGVIMFSLTQQVHSYSSLLVGMSYKLLAQERGLEQGRRRYMCDLPDSPEKMGFLAKERSEKA